MHSIKVRLCGVGNGLLMDPMSDETLDGLDRGIPRPEVKDRPMLEKAAAKIYRDPETGRIGLPLDCIYGCLKGAGRKVKNGKQNISTATSTTLFELLEIEGQFLPFAHIPEDVTPDDEAKFWKPDRRRGVGRQAKTPTAVVITRPLFQVWEVEFAIRFDRDVVNPGILRKLVEQAGRWPGLCGFRPGCGGPFGRFAVTAWTIFDEDGREVKIKEEVTPTTAAMRGKRTTGGRLAELEGSSARNDGELLKTGV